MKMSHKDRRAQARQARDALRAEGLRQVQIWIYDTHNTDFVSECRRQCRVSDLPDEKLQGSMDAALLKLHPIKIWVIDVHRPGFAEECLRQTRIAAQTDSLDVELQDYMDVGLENFIDKSE